MARFAESDAVLIDQEQRYGFETWNDLLSYRYIHHWQELWAADAIGVRISAGSLTARRFTYHRGGEA